MNNLTEDQKACIAMLEDWAGGRHHLPKIHEFGSGVCINHYGDLSTYDGSGLTRLVLLAHRDAIRVKISSSGPRMVRIICHKRAHGSRKEMRTHEFHPSLSDLIEFAKEQIPQP